MSVMSAPPRMEVYILWGNYGATGGAVVQSRSRLWILTDGLSPDDRMWARVAWNHPTTGQVVYEDVGEVVQATLRQNGNAEVHVAGGKVLTFLAAPCVCGAGAVGAAMPEAGRISLNYVNPHERVGRLTIL